MALFNIPPLSILRLAQCLVAVISLSLLTHLASIINISNSRLSTPPQLNLALFTSIYTLLVVLPYTTLAPRWFPRLAQRHVMMLMELSASIFWGAGMVALADWVRKGLGGRSEGSEDRVWRDEKATAVAGTCFASLAFILFTTSTYFALSHFLTPSTSTNPQPRPTHTRASPSHHTQKASVSSISKLLPTHTNPTTRTIHVDRSDKDPPYKRTQYRFDASARPLSFRSFKSVAAASKARSRNYFTLLREQQEQEERAKKRRFGEGLNCGLGVGVGRERWSEKEWEKMDLQPNLVVVPVRGPGSGWARGYGEDRVVAEEARPYSTKMLDAAGRIWGRAGDVVADLGSKVMGSGAGGHASWFGNGRRAGDAQGGWTRVGISHPGGGSRPWNGAEIV